MAGDRQIAVWDTKDQWTHLRVDILNSEIRVLVNGKPWIRKIDKTFGDKGLIYLHTFGTHSWFREFRVSELKRSS